MYTLEQRWEILRHYFENHHQKIFFSDEAHFDLDGYVNKQNCRIWGTETRMHTLKSRRTQNESLFGADFRPPLQSMAIIIGPC